MTQIPSWLLNGVVRHEARQGNGAGSESFWGNEITQVIGDSLKDLGRSVTGLLSHENVVILARNSVFVEYVMVAECTFRFP